MSVHDRRWKYRTQADTTAPGYLARRFAKVRAEQEASKAKPQNVRQIKRRAA